LGTEANFGSDAYIAKEDEKRIFDSAESFFSRTRFGALYIHEGWGGVSLSIKPKGFYYDSIISPEENLSHGLDLLFGVKVTALSRYDTLFIVEGEFRNIGIDNSLLKAAAPIVAGATATHSEAEKKYAATFMPGFDLYFSVINEYFYNTVLGARYRLYNLDKVGNTVYDEEAAFMLHEMRLFGSYKIAPWLTAGLETQFELDGITLHEKSEDHKTEGRDSIFKGFYLQPSLIFTIGKGLSFVVRDKVYFYNESWIANPYSNGAYLLNQVKLDFIWSF
jgi:hypothetical protein